MSATSLMLLLAHAGESVEGHRVELPPLHPILVNFTAALVPASFVSDLLGRLLRKQSLTSAGWWMLLYAAVITPFTVIAGWLWRREMEGMDMPKMTIHQWLGTALVAVFLFLVIWRWRIHRRPDGAPSGRYLTCATVVVAALVFQGHLGGKMSFGSQEPQSDHALGQRPHDHQALQSKGSHPSEHEDDHGGAAPAMKPHGSDRTSTPPTTSPSAAEMLEPLLSGSRPADTAPATPASAPHEEHRHPQGQWRDHIDVP